jgi:hypothetical protein
LLVGHRCRDTHNRDREHPGSDSTKGTMDRTLAYLYPRSS